jgi:hypothetical protein
MFSSLFKPQACRKGKPEKYGHRYATGAAGDLVSGGNRIFESVLPEAGAKTLNKFSDLDSSLFNWLR